MRLRWVLLGAPVALALLLVLAPIAMTPSHAQMGPMMGQPLDQLTGDDFDKTFLSQMTMHHAMAVMMARPAVANASHQELKDLAQGILNDQTRETAEMRSWGTDWYGMDIPDHVAMMDQMMDHGRSMPGMNPSGMAPGMGMPMHGGMPMGQMGDMSMMHTMSMMASLWKLPPQRLDVVFMSMMIPHHQGAIDMARLVPDRATHPELTDLSKNVIESQAREIDTMHGWLASWYSL
jgi:uncharacterized protein (DUF305 family)